MAMASSLLLPLLLLSLLPLFSSLPSDAILNAAAILKDSPFSSMALTLELASHSLLHHSPSLTIFAAADSAFSLSGQPPLSLLQYHLLPHAFSLPSLRSLPAGAKISTMLPSRFLTLTTQPKDAPISLNNVSVGTSPVYDDGSIVIFGIERFFDPFFESLAANSKRIVRPDLECRDSSIQSDPVGVLAAALRNRGWSVMASFLDLQFLGFRRRPALTIFAPADDSLTDRVGNFTDWRSIFRRHVVPCRLRWSDLADFPDGTRLRTYLKGFNINVNRSGGVLMLNDMSVIFPDMFYSEGVVVHGIGGILEMQREIKRGAESSSDVPLRTGPPPESDKAVARHYHFSVFRS